jgi:Cu2+-exporting ATPase
LLRENLKLAIASGDSETAVKAAAGSLGITEFHARMDFTAKREFVRRCQASGANILMVGDGINDGPVLASANVSCALTDGSAIAQSAADLLLLNRSLPALAKGVALARRARHIVRQNLGWALVYNVTMVPLAAAGCVAPWVAALGMSVSSLAVVLNSARLAATVPA